MAGQRVANTPAISIIGIAYRAPGPGRPECGERHEFDHDWFGIDAHEANRMDLAQYRALEVAIEAVDDAGIGYLLRGSDTAILLAVCAGTAAFTRSTHRLAAVLDLHGPRLVLDHADPASGAAIELATNMLTEASVPFVIVIEVGRSASALAGVRADTEPSDSITALVLQRTADASGARTLSHADIIGTASASDRERLEPEDIGVAGLDVGTDQALVR
ncbi:MAG: hypothetical protein J2P18_23540, partial [Nocardia sp.]|nr:hypothetical protein [Nocardia sp.]